MPNHITTQVAIHGSEEKIKKLIEDTKIKLDAELDEGSNEFDFNGIIKMPEEVHETVASPQIVETEEEAKQINEDYAAKDDGKFPGISQYHRAISVAEKHRRLNEYGALDWYDWSNANWGTKWNAYDVHYTDHKFDGENSKLVIQVTTAWDTPREIWKALEEQGFKVNGVYYGEMDGYDYIGDGSEDFDAYQNVEVEYVG